MNSKVIKFMGLGLTALFVMDSCSRLEEERTFPAEENQETVQMTVHSGDPSVKTVIDELGGGRFGILWEAGNVLGAVEKGTSSAQLVSSSPLSTGGATAEFSFSITGATSASYDYSFVYPASALTFADSKYKVTLPAEQTFKANSFDPAADVLVSEHLHTTSRPTSVNAAFVRLGGTARMTIKAPSTSETIQKIIFSSTASIKIAGSYELDPATGELSAEMLSGTNSITLTPAEATTYTGDVVVWFRLAELTLTDNFTVSVVTSAKTYTKTLYLSSLGRSLEFRNSALTTFGIDMRAVGGVDNFRSDVINAEFTGSTHNYYDAWSGKQGSATDAVYAGVSNCIDGKMGIKKNIVENNGHVTNAYTGIVSTSSGGNLASVTLSVYSDETKYERTVDVYAKNTPYSSPDDLFDAETAGTKVGSVTTPAKTTTTETILIPAGYTYVGIRSNDYTSYLAEARITWEGAPLPSVSTGEATDITHSTATLAGSFASATGGIYEAGFYWDTNASDLANLAHPGQVITTDGSASVSGNFSCTLGSLNELTTYYYRSYILWLNTETNTYQEFLGDIQSFATITRDYSTAGWLELPAYTTSGMSGTTTSSLSDLYCVTHKAEMGGTEQRNYTLLYDPEMYASYWVAYPICSNHLGTGRVESWAYDPKVPSGKQVNILDGGYGVKDELNKYFDRGHQIPNADRSGVDAMQSQTYFSTNITPQRADFNQDIWADLEAAVRTAVHSGDTVYVVTGAAFKKKGYDDTIQTITCGYRQDYMTLQLPNYYWKVLLKVKWNGTSVNNACTVAFWMEHRPDLKDGGKTYQNYVTSVNQIEEWTGFDFFANLPTDLQDIIETQTDWTTFKNF